MDSLNAIFVGQNGLVFDIGAHVGDRTDSFLRLGASVVALEPQPRLFRALRLLHGTKPGAVLRPWAAGRNEGTIRLFLNPRNPTVATVAPDFISAASDAEGWRDERWDDSVDVPVTTLDALIARHGVPDFIKIDVEGHEAEVLAGLSHSVPALSFELTTIQRDCAHRCVDRLSALGDYRFNFSLGEEHSLRHRDWMTVSAMHLEIDTLPHRANSGDIYARLA